MEWSIGVALDSALPSDIVAIVYNILLIVLFTLWKPLETDFLAVNEGVGINRRPSGTHTRVNGSVEEGLGEVGGGVVYSWFVDGISLSVLGEELATRHAVLVALLLFRC